jgi:hypothetical protein
VTLKTYRYVYVLTHIEPGDGEDAFVGAVPEPDLYTDERSLPSSVTSVEVRKAKDAPTEAVWSPRSMAFLTYAPIQGN